MAADAHPAWLQAVLRDRSPAPPRVYRWTVADVVRGRGGTTPELVRNADPDPDRGIYILGVGNLGRLFAVALAQLPEPPPVTLVVHRPGLLEQWHAHPGVRLDRALYTKFDVEMWSDEPPPPTTTAASSTGSGGGSTAELGPLTNLIVATKAQAALGQVDRVRRYLGPASTVAFLQNGVNRLWPPSGAVYNAARYGEAVSGHPRWLACVVTHGVLSHGPFWSELASPADVKLGMVDGDGDGDGDETPPYLVQQLLKAPLLAAKQLPRPELWVTQLEKLAVNAVINPLTALLRCRNGELFASGGDAASSAGADDIPRIIDQLLREASSVFLGLARHDPSSRRLLGLTSDNNDDDDDNTLLSRLSYDALRAMVGRVGALVQHNTSSMLQDVRAGRMTEVREFNGWIVDTAAYLGRLGVAGPDVRGHRAMVRMVEAGEPVARADLGRRFDEAGDEQISKMPGWGG